MSTQSKEDDYVYPPVIPPDVMQDYNALYDSNQADRYLQADRVCHAHRLPCVWNVQALVDGAVVYAQREAVRRQTVFLYGTLKEKSPLQDHMRYLYHRWMAVATGDDRSQTTDRRVEITGRLIRYLNPTDGIARQVAFDPTHALKRIHDALLSFHSTPLEWILPYTINAFDQYDPTGGWMRAIVDAEVDAEVDADTRAANIKFVRSLARERHTLVRSIPDLARCGIGSDIALHISSFLMYTPMSQHMLAQLQQARQRVRPVDAAEVGMVD